MVEVLKGMDVPEVKNSSLYKNIILLYFFSQIIRYYEWIHAHMKHIFKLNHTQTCSYLNRDGL